MLKMASFYCYRWLQPESYIDHNKCDLIVSPEKLTSSWPTTLTLHTKDQYGSLAFAPNVTVSVRIL